MKKTALASILSFFLLFSIGSVLVYTPNNQTTDKVYAQITGGPESDETDGPESDETEGPGIKVKLDNPFRSGDSLSELMSNIFDGIIFPLGGILAVLAFIYSGFLFVTAQGNESKLGKAKRALLYTAIGTAILLGARVISEVISGTIEQLK